jgi:hypothetical protein
MKQLSLILAGVAFLSACSGGREERRPVTDRIAQQPDLTLPDTIARPGTVARKDTSVTLSARSQDTSVTRSSPSVAPKPSPSRHRTRPAPHKARPQPEDTAVRAYAPRTLADSGVADTTPSAVASRETAPKTADTATAPPPDSLTSPLETSAESATTAPVDTTHRPATDTVGNRSDTARAGVEPTRTPVDTARTAADTADTARTAADTTRTAADTTRTAADTARPVDSATARAPSDTNSAAPAVTPPTAVPSASAVAARTLPIGTEIHAALDDSITSRRDTVGRQLSGHVMENVIGPDGRTLIAAGSPVRFTITRIRPSRSKNSQGRLSLRADGIALSGQLRPVKADIQAIPRELRGRGVTASEAAKVGGGAAAGAVIGGAVGKTKGAVIGGVAGAAAGAVVASQTATRDVVVKAKTPVVLVLTAPLVAP